MSEQQEVKYCPDCGADNLSIANHCFMCARSLKDVQPQTIIEAELVEARPRFVANDWIFVAILVLLTSLAAAYAFGVAWDDGLGMVVLFAIFVLPGIVIAALDGLRRRARGEGYGWQRALFTIFLSTVVSLSAVVMLIIAFTVVVIAFFIAVCHPMFNGNGGRF